MPSNRLTVHAVRALEAQGKAYKVFDGQGLYLAVLPSGVKSWRWQYREGGRQQTLTIGTFPQVGLADARQRRQEAAAKLSRGESLRAPPKRATPPFRAACEAYWEGRQDVSAGYRENALAALKRHLIPALGDVPISDVTREQIMAELRRMEAADLLVYLRKVKRWAGLVFEHAVEHGHRADNPVSGIRTERAFARRTEIHHAALAPAQIGDLLDRLRLEPPILSVLGCWLLAYTWARPGEVRAMRWDEIKGDLWRVPASRTKRRRDHLVPLSRQAVAVLARLRDMRLSDYVLPNDRRLDRPSSENAILYLLHRIGFQGRMTAHGWRSVGSTWANEAGWSVDVIERALAHEPADRVRSAYNRAEYLTERRAMLQAWADWLDGQGSPSQTGAASTRAKAEPDG